MFDAKDAGSEYGTYLRICICPCIYIYIYHICIYIYIYLHYSQFPNLGIILGARHPQEESDLGAKLFMCGSGGGLFLMCEEREEEKGKSRGTRLLKSL